MKVILDCELDNHTSHKWEKISRQLPLITWWCRDCGAIGMSTTMFPAQVTVEKRVQEEVKKF